MVVDTLTRTSIKSIHVLKAIKAVVGDYIKNSIREYQRVAPEEGQDINTGHQIVMEYDMNTDVFDLLRPRLPFHVDLFKVIIDLDAGRLHIRTVPSLCHEAACGAWDPDINGWSNNHAAVPPNSRPPLRPTRSGGIYRASEFTNVRVRLFLYRNIEEIP
jgi:hypothetical protein